MDAPSSLCCGFQQGLGSGAEEEGVNLLGVLNRQLTDLLRQSKHHVKIGDGQKLRLPLLEPACTSHSLALGAMAVATRVI
jgi:hypothetical protein